MQHSDAKLNDVLSKLSEESLSKLRELLQKRTWRAARKVNGGDAPGDLAALRLLLSAVEAQHEKALVSSD